MSRKGEILHKLSSDDRHHIQDKFEELNTKIKELELKNSELQKTQKQLAISELEKVRKIFYDLREDDIIFQATSKVIQTIDDELEKFKGE